MLPRFHYIDNLRSLALLLGIVFHAALAYGPYFQNIWFTSDPNNHVAFDYFAMWSHLFRMPLFFLIAGFCAALLIAKRGNKGFIINRLKRVLLPFLVFMPISIALIFHAMSFGASIADPLPPLFSVFKAVKEPVLSTMHLWFLWNLIQFCILFWLLSLWQPAFQTLLSFVVKPVFILAILPVLVTVAMYNQMIPFPAPDKLYPQAWSYGLYGTSFLIGAGFYYHHSRLQTYFKGFYALLLPAVASTFVYFYVLPAPLTLNQVIEAANMGEVVPEQINLVALIAQSIAIVSWTAIAMLAGYKWLNRHSKLSLYMSNASYWIYLIHIPVLMYIQLPLINVAVSPFIKLVVSVLATMFVGLVSYHLLVRNTLIGVFLNGKRARENKPQKNENVQLKQSEI